MDVIFSTKAKEDLAYWEKNNQKMALRIKSLLADIKKTPFKGIGRPEPLRFKHSGYWSRRINKEHRLVYKIANNCIYIAQCRYHY